MPEEEGRSQEQAHIEDQKGWCDRCIICLGPRYVVLLTEEERDAVWHLRRRVVNNPKPLEPELQKQARERGSGSGPRRASSNGVWIFVPCSFHRFFHDVHVFF